MNKIACLFPGQGSQSLGMLGDLVDTFPSIKTKFEQASSVLGYDLWNVTQQGPVEDLNRTDITQPALLAASVALWECVKSSVSPSYFAGHSLGEYSALVCAGVIDFETAISLVKLRGELMLEAVPVGVGAMYAILGLEDDKVASICEQISTPELFVSPANYNCPGQIVIAGHKEAVEAAGAACKESGAKRAQAIPVSVPSHCKLMTSAAEKLALELEKITFNEPSVPVVNNVDVAIETSPDNIKSALIQQLYSPVRWTETVQFLTQQQVSHYYEVGPGKVLSGLVKRVAKEAAIVSLNTIDSIQSLK